MWAVPHTDWLILHAVQVQGFEERVEKSDTAALGLPKEYIADFKAAV